MEPLQGDLAQMCLTKLASLTYPKEESIGALVRSCKGLDMSEKTHSQADLFQREV